MGRLKILNQTGAIMPQNYLAIYSFVSKFWCLCVVLEYLNFVTF
jgi:hypothetical protein